jgi:hypothetical protein
MSTSFYRRNPLFSSANRFSVFALDFFHSLFDSGTGEIPAVLTLRQIQQPLRGISFFRRRSSCSLTGKASF